ncbi:hypothetical protein DFO55_1503 [Grimontella sp. AG753]|nr:hypothetical protein DFO55_1503 [Grimontella sp. AG753]
MNNQSFDPKSSHLAVGQVVYTGLYGLGRGVISAIYGEQRPDSAKTHFGGVMVSGGKAEFDILFECGSESRRLPECILRGVQWQIFDEAVGKEEIERIRQIVKETQIAKLNKQAAADAEYAARKKELADEPKYKALEKIGNSSWTHTAIVAKNIRVELKAAYPAVKFSVRKTGYDSITVKWIDGPTVDQIRDITLKYKTGHYDMYADLHESKSTPFTDIYGGVDYLNVSREYSLELKQTAIDNVRKKYGSDIVPESCTVDAYTKGDLWHVSREFFFNNGVGGEIDKELRGLQG